MMNTSPITNSYGSIESAEEGAIIGGDDIACANAGAANLLTGIPFSMTAWVYIAVPTAT